MILIVNIPGQVAWQSVMHVINNRNCFNPTQKQLAPVILFNRKNNTLVFSFVQLHNVLTKWFW